MSPYLNHHRHSIHDHAIPDVIGVHDEKKDESLEGEFGLVAKHEHSGEEEGGEEDEEAVGIHSQNEEGDHAHHHQ